MKNETGNTLYFLCHTDEDTIHYCEVYDGQTIDTGLATMKNFPTEAALDAHLDAAFSPGAQGRVRADIAGRAIQ